MGSIVSNLAFKDKYETMKKQEILDFFEAKINDIDGKPIYFSQFKGKKVFIIVNIA